MVHVFPWLVFCADSPPYALGVSLGQRAKNQKEETIIPPSNSTSIPSP